MKDAKTLLLEFLAVVTHGKDAAALFAESSGRNGEALQSLGRDEEARQSSEHALELVDKVLVRRPGNRMALHAQQMNIGVEITPSPVTGVTARVTLPQPVLVGAGGGVASEVIWPRSWWPAPRKIPASAPCR